MYLFGLTHVSHVPSSRDHLNFVITIYNTSNLITHVNRSAARLPVRDVPIHHLIRLALLSHFASLHRATVSRNNNTKQCSGVLTALTAESLPCSLRSSKLIISPHTNLFSKSELHPEARQQLSYTQSHAHQRYSLDDSSRLWRLDPFADRPRPHFVRTTCEVSDEVKARISRSSYPSERRGRASFGFFFLLFLWI